MTTPYHAEIHAWRENLERSLRREKGWLALEGLYWLQPGENTLGASPSSDVVLSSGPDRTGIFDLTGGRVFLRTHVPGRVLVDGVQVVETELHPDTDASPSQIQVGNLHLIVLQRHDHFGVRIWNPDRPERQAFPGRTWYPVDPSYRVSAVFQSLPQPLPCLLPDASGLSQELFVVGKLEFSLHGSPLELLALEETPQELFLIFTDQTSRTETYPGGRYLYNTLEDPQNVILDFNKAYNPPCAFTPYATCPLPLPENRLRIAVAAGEKYPQPAGEATPSP